MPNLSTETKLITDALRRAVTKHDNFFIKSQDARSKAEWFRYLLTNGNESPVPKTIYDDVRTRLGVLKVEKRSSSDYDSAVTETESAKLWIEKAAQNEPTLGLLPLRWILIHLRQGKSITGAKFKNNDKRVKTSFSNSKLGDHVHDKLVELKKNGDYQKLARTLGNRKPFSVAQFKKASDDYFKRKTRNDKKGDAVFDPSRTISDFFSNEGLAYPGCAVAYYLVEYLLGVGALPIADDHSEPTVVNLALLQCGIESLFNRPTKDKQTAFINAAIGCYYLYRPSQLVPTSIVRVGLRVTIETHLERDEVTEVLVAKEEHSYGGESGVENSEGRPDRPGGFGEMYTGVMFRRSHTVCMIASRRSHDEDSVRGTGEVGRGPPRFTLCHRVIYDNERGKVASMTGITLSQFAGGQSVALPVCIERIWEAEGKLGQGKTENKKLSRQELLNTINKYTFIGLGVFPDGSDEKGDASRLKSSSELKGGGEQANAKEKKDVRKQGIPRSIRLRLEAAVIDGRKFGNW
jgi:hypothetical protein